MIQVHALRRAAIVAGLALSTLTATAQEGLRDADQKALGKVMLRYIEKLSSPKDADKAREDLRDELEKVGKKLAGKSGDPMQAVLAQTAGLGGVIYNSYGYKNQKGGKTEERRAKGRTGEAVYSLWLPGNYKPSDGPIPLWIIVPSTKDGRVVPGAQFLQENWTEAELRDGIAMAAVDMPADLDLWSEQFSQKDGAKVAGGLSILMDVLGDLTLNFGVDSNRVYLVGQGAGVATAMKLASLYPQLFAGVIGRAGDVGDVGFENFMNLPVLLLGAGAKATAFEESAKAAGYTGVSNKPEANASDVRSWVNDHPRAANPAKVMLVPGRPIPTRAYWLEVPPMDSAPGTYVKGEVDRATNTIQIEGKGVPSVVIYLNDVMVDLDKPLKFVLNGQAQDATVPRSLDDFLTMVVRGTCDTGRVYVAVSRFDLPQ